MFKYNDGKFTSLNPKDLPPGVTKIDGAFNDNKGFFWVVFANGKSFAKLKGTTWQVFSIRDNALLASGVNAIYEDKSEKLYAVTHDGLVTYDGKSWQKLALPKESLYAYTIRAIDADDKGNLAVGLNSGLLLYDGKDWKMFNEDNSKLALDVVTALKYLANGDLYIGYGGGVGAGGFSIFKDGNWQNFDRRNSKMPDQEVRIIKTTKSGIIWLGTNNGIVKIKSDDLTVIKPFAGVNANTIMSLEIDSEKVWAICARHGLVEIDPTQ